MGFIKHTLSFAAGELSEWLDGRTDLDKYGAGCRILQNFIALPQGAIQKRPGLEYLGTVEAGATAGRLVEFQISTTEAAMLVLGGGKLAVWADGAPVLDAGLPISIAIPWADGELELLRWRQINSVCYFVHPDHAPRKLTRYAADDWEIVEVDTGLSPALLPENGNEEHTISTVFTVGGAPSPWSAAFGSYPAGARVTYTGKTWVCMKTHNSAVGKEPGTGTYLEAVLVSGRVTQYVSKPLWVEGFADTSAVVGQAISLTSSWDTWQAGHVGAVFEISKKRGSADYETKLQAINANNGKYSVTIVVQGGWTFETFGTWKGTFTLERSDDRGATWEEVRAYESDGERNVSDEGEEAKRVLMRIKWTHSAAGSSDPRGVLSASDAYIRGLVRITAVTDARTASADVLSPVEKTTTYNWAESAWNDVQGYPRVIELHQARVIMAATALKPHTVWGSAVDDYEKFYPGTLADEGFRHTVAIGERDPILWLVSERFLLIGTGSGEWIMHGEDEEKAIVPEFGVAKRHSSYGAHNGGVPACFADSVSLFVQRGGTRVREFSYRFEADRYEAANLNLLADHLFTGPIDDIAVQRMPWQVVWFISGGKLYGLTYERAQNVAAWHRHETSGQILSVGTIRATGEEDEVWFLIDRGQGDIFVERFRPGHMTALPDDGWWQDSAVSLPYPHDLGDAAHLDGLDVTGHANGEAFGPVELSGTVWPFIAGHVLAIDADPSTGGVLVEVLWKQAGTRGGKPWFVKFGSDPTSDFMQYITGDGNPRWGIYLGGELWFQSVPQFDSTVPEQPSEAAMWEATATGAGFLPVFTQTVQLPPPAWASMMVLGPGIAGIGLIEVPPLGIGGSGTLLYDGTHPTVGRIVIFYIGGSWRMSFYDMSGTKLYEWRSTEDVASPDLVTAWTLHSGSVPGLPTVTPLYLEGSTALVVGLPYTAAVQPMTPELPLANGSSRSREARVHRVTVSMRTSRGGKIGETLDGPHDPLEVGSASERFTGEHEHDFDGGHSTDVPLVVVSEDPFPFAIRTLALKMEAFGDAD